jgi:hypothetical protein
MIAKRVHGRGPYWEIFAVSIVVGDISHGLISESAFEREFSFTGLASSLFSSTLFGQCGGPAGSFSSLTFGGLSTKLGS